VFLSAVSLDKAARRIACLTHIIYTQYMHTCIQLHLPSSLPLTIHRQRSGTQRAEEGLGRSDINVKIAGLFCIGSDHLRPVWPRHI